MSAQDYEIPEGFVQIPGLPNYYMNMEKQLMNKKGILIQMRNKTAYSIFEKNKQINRFCLVKNQRFKTINPIKSRCKCNTATLFLLLYLLFSLG